MTIAERLLPELDHEMATTRSLLAIVPDDRADWRPHPKSTPLGGLAIHIAQVCTGLGSAVVNLPGIDFATLPPRPGYESTAKMIADFDAGLAEFRAALAKLSDEAMMETWTMSAGDRVFLAMPRVATLRTLIMNHSIHHRGQLSVYLRELDVPLPSIYGPTADTPV